RTASRRADRGLETVIPYQRPAQRFAPEEPDLPRTGARKLCQESAAGKPFVAGLDDAELVAVGVCEYDVTLLGELADVDVSGAESEQPCHRLLLVIERRAR